MSRYTPVGPTPSYPPRPPALHRTSSSLASHPSRQHEMEAAFDDSDEDEDDDDENRPLSQARGGRGLVWDAGDDAGLPDEDARAATNGVSASSSATSPPPADGVDDPLRRPIALRPATTLQPTDAEPTYDFDRDYFLPPPGSPPPGAYPENYAPTGPTPLTTTPAYPSAPSAPSRFIRSLLPTHFTRSAAPSPRGSDGVFANLTAKPELESEAMAGGGDGSDGDNLSVMAEFAAKDAPPAYQVAARDAVPPYWEHNVVAPSFGPLGAITGSGDDLLIDGLPVGNFFGFGWNLLVSMSFQFVGFLLTYVLHTTHSSKYGSRAGLGVTLIQYGLYLRTRAQEIRDTGMIDPDDSDTSFGNGFGGLFGGSGHGGNMVEASTELISSAVATATATASSVAASASAIVIPTFGSWAEAIQWKQAHPNTPVPGLNLPSPEEVSEANDWLSFVLMCAGWFILITSLGGYWRVKRYERSLLAAQANDDDDIGAVSAPGISLSTIRDWYRTRGTASSGDSSSSAAANNTSYPGADLSLPHELDDGEAADEQQHAPREGGRGDNAFRQIGRSVSEWRAQLLARAQAIREFRDRQRERQRREEEGEFML